MGNLGAETKCLGDLRHMDLDVAAEVIKAIPGNRDYGAFYDPQVLPSCQKIINALRGLPQDMVYGDFESIRYRGLEELRVPTRMLENQTKSYKKSFGNGFRYQMNRDLLKKMMILGTTIKKFQKIWIPMG